MVFGISSFPPLVEMWLKDFYIVTRKRKKTIVCFFSVMKLLSTQKENSIIYGGCWVKSIHLPSPTFMLCSAVVYGSWTQLTLLSTANQAKKSYSVLTAFTQAQNPQRHRQVFIFHEMQLVGALNISSLAGVRTLLFKQPPCYITCTVWLNKLMQAHRETYMKVHTLVHVQTHRCWLVHFPFAASRSFSFHRCSLRKLIVSACVRNLFCR